MTTTSPSGRAPQTGPPAQKARGPRSRFRRKVAGAVALSLGLLTAGGLYTALAPQPQVATAQGDSALIAKGQELYNNTCVTCHGANLQGVAEHGPSLIGVGEAAAYFQVSSGRMPLARQEAQATRKPPMPQFDPATEDGRANLDALGAFVEANGGGPAVPVLDAQAIQDKSDPARGGELFRLNCASCHNFTGRGGALSSGKFAPDLDPASETQIYTAMLSGPQNMPKFSDKQLSPAEKEDIIAYVKSVTNGNNNPGGNALGGIGPVSEGLVAFIVGLVALIGFAMWLGAKT